ELSALEPEYGDRALELPDGGADVLHGQRGEASEAPRPLTHHGRDLVVDLTGQRLPRGGVEVIPEERRVNGQDLDVHALRVHVLEPLLRREAHLGRDEAVPLAAADDDPDALAGLVAEPVPLLAGVRGPPERLRHEVRVDVDGPHRMGAYSSTSQCGAKRKRIG